MIRVLVADDHAIVRQGLSRLLSTVPDMALVGEAADGVQVLEWLKHSPADLLILDMSMPGQHGNDLITTLVDRYPDLPILVLSISSDSHTAAGAVRSGVRGYVTKDSDPDMILAAIRQCASGGYYIQPDLSMRLVLSGEFTQEQGLNEILSSRERQVFHMLVKGLPINAIGDTLHISPKTVSAHKGRIQQKLGLETVAEMVRYAIRHELIEP